MKVEQKTKAQLSQELETYTNRLFLLNQMSQQMNLAISEDEVFKSATRYASKIFPADRVSIALFQEKENQMEVFTLRGEIGEIPIGKQIPVDGTLVGKSLKEKKVMRIYNINNPEFLDLRLLSKEGMQSFLVAPMINGRQPLGTLNIASHTENAYNFHDENLLLNMADYLCVSIDRIRKTLALKKNKRTLETIATKVSHYIPPQLYQSIFLEVGIK